MACDFRLLPHEGIQTLAPYIPGKSIEELAREQGLTDIIKLASNENPLGCSEKVLQALGELSGQLVATYPISASHPLREKIAEKLQIQPNMVTLGNGSDLLFTLILTCFGLHQKKHVLVPNYSFISFEIQAKTLGIPVIKTPLTNEWKVDVESIVSQANEKTALIFIANPNNPTNSLLGLQELAYILSNIPPSTILILDEAYHEYIEHSDAYQSIKLLKNHPNLIITRTFSKAYGLAGLRIGYSLATKEITSILLRALLPFTVSQTALVGASIALDDDEFIQRSLKANWEGLMQMQYGLNALNIDYLPPSGNFLTINLGRDAGVVYQKLLQKGIIVRPLHAYKLNNYLRVTVGTSAQNARFLDTLPICLEETKESLA